MIDIKVHGSLNKEPLLKASGEDSSLMLSIESISFKADRSEQTSYVAVVIEGEEDTLSKLSEQLGEGDKVSIEANTYNTVCDQAGYVKFYIEVDSCNIHLH